MEDYTINDNFVYEYLQNKLDDVLNEYTIPFKPRHIPGTKTLQYQVPEHPSDTINICINESKIDISLPLLRSPFSYATRFYINKNDPTNIFNVLQFLHTHLKYYENCYL